MKEIFEGKVKEVIKDLKKETINILKSIFQDSDCDSYDFDEIKLQIAPYIEFIDLIYQDIITGQLNYNDEIKSQLYDNSPYPYYRYDLINIKENK